MDQVLLDHKDLLESPVIMAHPVSPEDLVQLDPWARPDPLVTPASPASPVNPVLKARWDPLVLQARPRRLSSQPISNPLNSPLTSSQPSSPLSNSRFHSQSSSSSSSMNNPVLLPLLVGPLRLLPNSSLFPHHTGGSKLPVNRYETKYFNAFI